MKNTFLALLLCLPATYASAQHTFSIVAIDAVTGEIGSAGATCGDSIMWPGTPGAKLISSVVPGKFAIHTQAMYLPGNQDNAVTRMQNGDSPQQTIDWLVSNDYGSDSSVRQYGIVDYNGGNPRSAAFTGAGCMDYKNHLTGPGYSIQGNILLGQQILDEMQSRFLNTQGSLAKRLMAALQGANVAGADTRCMSNGTSSLSAFLRVAKPTDQSNNLYIDVNVGAVPTGVEPIDVLQVKMNSILSVEENNPGNHYAYRIYPNPATDKIQLDFSRTLPDEIAVSDASGRLIKTYTSKDISFHTTLDLPILRTGMYFIRFYKQDMPVHNDRIIISR